MEELVETLERKMKTTVDGEYRCARRDGSERNARGARGGAGPSHSRRGGRSTA